MRTFLVTGGFGFIGGHLVEELLSQDSDTHVHVVDDLSSSPLPPEVLMAQFSDRSRVTYDLCTVEEYFDSGPATFHGIYHLASPVGPAGVLEHAGEMVRRIVDDSYRVMDHCVETGSKLLDVSTSEVYGGGQEGYCSETAAKIVPPGMTVRLEYALAKLAIESAVANTCRAKGLIATIVRPFNVSGPRQSPRGGFVLPRFIRQAHAGEALTVFGSGEALRAFTHVRDMASGMRLAMEKGASGQIYNLGNPNNKISIRALAEMVIDLMESSSPIEFVDPKTIFGDMFEEANDKFPAAERAFSELGWQPSFGVREIVKHTHEDYLTQVAAGAAWPE